MLEWIGDKVEQGLNVGGKLLDHLGRVVDNVGNVLPTEIRQLNSAENATISFIYQTSMTGSNLRITNGQGADGRPWCSPSKISRQYYLNVGDGLFNSNLGGTSLLIHESMHAWQGLFGMLSQSYIAGAAHCQGMSLLSTGSVTSSYNYEGQEDKPFAEYTIEQQASLVTHWRQVGNGSPWDWRYRYIRDNIRPGLPNAEGEPIGDKPYVDHDLILSSKPTVQKTYKPFQANQKNLTAEKIKRGRGFRR